MSGRSRAYRRAHDRYRDQAFAGGRWLDEIDVRDFVQRNYTPYAGDGAFLAGPTDRTLAVWGRLPA